MSKAVEERKWRSYTVWPIRKRQSVSLDHWCDSSFVSLPEDGDWASLRSLLL